MNSRVKLVLKKKKAINTFRGFYQIQWGEEENEKFASVIVEELEDYYPLPAYEFEDHLCLTLKHSSPSMD